jgi:hypothetical protein
MRSLLLALVALALLATPASAAVIELEDHFCGCDGSSGETDTVGLIVRAAVLRVRPLVPLRRDALIQAVGVSVRDDNVHSVTRWLAGL